MNSFSQTKHDNDGFVFFSPKAIYQDIYGKDPNVIYDSEYAYYRKNIYKKIEKEFKNFERKTAKILINKNKSLVETEIIYSTKLSPDESISGQYVDCLIAIKQFWNIDEYAIGEFDEDEFDEEQIVINPNDKFQAKITIYAPFHQKKLEKLFKLCVSKDKTVAKKERELNIVCFHPQDGIYLKAFNTNKVDIDIDINYNDDFKEVSDKIVSTLSSKHDNGIVLLHSEPGCGKTSYLRFLTHNIKNKRLIYLPPDMAHRLSDPDFMGFLMTYPDSVLFIEDAENCLQKREGGGNQAVSNLLNSSDGLLGDALKLQIICTFNCNIGLIDPALLRPGRLIAEYKFEKLSINKAKAIVNKIYDEDTAKLITEPKTLAEIYNLNKKQFLSANAKQSPIGFGKR